MTIEEYENEVGQRAEFWSESVWDAYEAIVDREVKEREAENYRRLVERETSKTSKKSTKNDLKEAFG